VQRDHGTTADQVLEKAEAPVDRPPGIVWLRWESASLDFIAEQGRPVFLFVGDLDPAVAPYLQALLRALPKNEKIRRLLGHEFPALFIESNAAVPEELAAFGAGDAFHVALLSPAGLTPLFTFNYVNDNADELAGTIGDALERLAGIWP
jgi:hypothetical protein